MFYYISFFFFDNMIQNSTRCAHSIWYYIKYKGELYMKKKVGRIVTTLFVAMSILFISISSYAHSGRTDSSGGHKDNKNKSGLGGYHYHCGGYPAHLHKNGVCPYKTKSSTSTNKSKSNKKSSTSNTNNKTKTSSSTKSSTSNTKTTSKEEKDTSNVTEKTKTQQQNIIKNTVNNQKNELENTSQNNENSDATGGVLLISALCGGCWVYRKHKKNKK